MSDKNMESTSSLLQDLAKYYREVLKYVSSSASKVLQNVAAGQRFGLVADMSLLVKDPIILEKQTFKVHKPGKKIEIQKFEDEPVESMEPDEDEKVEELEETDEELAWSALNKIWRTQENNPYERETLIGNYLVKTIAHKKTLLAPMFIHQVEITYDPATSAFTLSKRSEKPDLNRSLIATLLPDDNLAPVRSQINELFLEVEDVDLALVKKMVDLLSNHVDSLKDIPIIEELTSLNDLSSIEAGSFIVRSSVVINTPRTGSFVLDDLDELSTADSDISGTPIEELLTVNFDETSSVSDEPPKPPISQQGTYFFPLKSNIQQQKICDEVMTKKLTVVWGPPGTGKSETISNLVCHLIANGKSVLVTSQQQKALEVVREKLKKNVSLSAPKHPNLSVPLELALIKGEKEANIAEDIRTKLDALGVYTLGIGSSYEINTKLQQLQSDLKTNKEKTLTLMKRFTELKLREKDRYVSKDSPLKLEELKDFAILDANEQFDSEDQVKNSRNIRKLALAIVALEKSRGELLNHFGKDLAYLNETLALVKQIGGLAGDMFRRITNLSEGENKLLSHLVINSESISASLELTNKLGSSWNMLKTVANEMSLGDKDSKLKIASLLNIPDASFEALDKIIARLKPHVGSVVEYDLSLQIESYSISDVEQELVILKNTNVSFLTKLIDGKAKSSLNRSAQLLGITNFDWRSKDLICSQLQKLLNLLKTKDALKGFGVEIEKLNMGISLEKLSLDQLSNLILELETILGTGKLLKGIASTASNEMVSEIVNEHIKVATLDNLLEVLTLGKTIIEIIDKNPDIVQKIDISTSYRELIKTSYLSKQLERLSTNENLLKMIIEYEESEEQLNLLPISRERIVKAIEENQYSLPSIFEKPELIVERHRLERLYGSDVTEETTEIIAQTIKRYESQKKEHIYNYILNTRLKMLHEASKSRLANANLVKLKTLLGRKKKTLNFLKKKDSIDFFQVLNYFPCWIASIDDVARYFPLVKGLFDYVIVDEASQCSQTSIPHLFFRSKNAVIVGDEKQLPNANLRFLQKGIMEALQRKYNLTTHEKSQFLDCKEFSLLTFAQAATPPLALIEHFRCDPTIIAWSNKNVYNNMMKIMTPIWENRFNPPMEVRYIANGAEDVEAKINPVEAKAILEEIKNLVSDKANKGLSIGVISPFRPQADLISELIYQEINPEIIREYALQSRTVDGFQGDERDIILYSMRFAPNGRPGSVTAIEGGVNEEGFRRMNVAFTRARRKVLIFTSAKLSEFPGKLIKSFMEHAKEIQDTYTDPFQPKEDSFDSKFEEDVCRMLRGRGINVVTQFECGGYRIDQVLFDKEGRTMALECDGDFKFDDSGDLPPEHYMRQATIERITQWDVFRITASTFYLDPEDSIDGIVVALRKQPTKVERKINLTDTETKASAIGLTQEMESKEETEIEQVLKVVETSPEVRDKEEKYKSKPKEKISKQASLFQVNIEGISTNSDIWFKLSHWGKSTGNFSSFQNRFCYSLGTYVSQKKSLTNKQEGYGKKLLESAVDKGFIYSDK